MTWHDGVKKVCYWELCKKLKFDPTNKWYKHNPGFLLKNKMHKHFWDFHILADDIISARRPDLIIINKTENLQTLLS